MESAVQPQFTPPTCHQDLSSLGLETGRPVHRNLPSDVLVQLAVARGEAQLVADGALATTTGRHTGRCPDDRYIVDRPGARDEVDWGPVNRPMEVAAADRLWDKARAHVRDRELFVQDMEACADSAHRVPVRVITETAWHSLFASNMFRAPGGVPGPGSATPLTVLQLPSLEADPATDGTRSQVAVVLDLGARTILISGTQYAGEIKKSVFSALNHLLPARSVLPMHCSANQGAAGDVAVLFGLSGTGKTTLSAEPTRTLIGDDEHGWSETGIFNVEGGCYAKVIRLSAADEPEIFAASTGSGAILENVVVDPETGAVDFDDDRLTENTRSSYPLTAIPSASRTGRAGHPAHVVMLTADAFGVLPPISRLTADQAMYHFLSGYTARIAGTEQGVAEPQATFSACFGAPFMPRHPTVYAEMLGERLRRHRVDCWLINTGWSGGPHGVGKRIALAHTRAMLRAALDGQLNDAPQRRHAAFGLMMPEHCPDVPDEVLDPRATWDDDAAYDRMAQEVAGRFAANFARFAAHVPAAVGAAGIHPA
jgi:phosphoenolpyruvate carboxykinase (ATP)